MVCCLKQKAPLYRRFVQSKFTGKQTPKGRIVITRISLSCFETKKACSSMASSGDSCKRNSYSVSSNEKRLYLINLTLFLLFCKGSFAQPTIHLIRIRHQACALSQGLATPWPLRPRKLWECFFNETMQLFNSTIIGSTYFTNQVFFDLLFC